MKNVTCIEDLRELARRKVPGVFFQYAEAGSYSQERSERIAPISNESSFASASWSMSRRETRPLQ